MKRSVILFFTLASWALTASAIPERLNGIITDEANIIDVATRQKIEVLGVELEKKTSAQIAVVTVSSLNGLPIEQVALTLFNPNPTINKPGVGQAEKNNGVLLLVAPNDRQMRIEVGYGLEHVIPDGMAGHIRDNAIVPSFKEGKMSEGIWNGAAEIAFAIAKDQGVALSGISFSPKAQQSQRRENKLNPLAVIFLIVMVILFIRNPWLALLLLSGRGRSSGNWSGGGFGGGGFGGFGGGMSGGGGASGRW